MNADERALARILLKVKILEANGQDYEDLFCTIMERCDPRFERVKPQGTLGDRKNDGYVKECGRYYQVYAPEVPSKSIAAAGKKACTDFAGLKDYWETIAPVKSYFFVFNDKLQGTFPDLEKVLDKLQKDYSLIECGVFRAHHLRQKVFSLPDADILEIVGFLPQIGLLETVEYSLLDEIIGFIFRSQTPVSLVQTLSAPDYSTKIKFNGLGDAVAGLLQNASYQVGHVDRFFENNTLFEKQDLRDKLKGLYEEVKGEQLMSEPDAHSADVSFFRILSRVGGMKSKHHQDCALVILAYFFEACDIFEDPPGVGNAVA